MSGFIGLLPATNEVTVSCIRIYAIVESATVKAMEATTGSGCCEIECRLPSVLRRSKPESG